MGLFDFFGKKTTTSKVDKAAKRMLNEHQQQQVRQEAMQELVNMDTPEAISALIRRLGVNFRDTIKNEQEKRWVHDTLVDFFKDRAIEPLVAFIRTDHSISAAILVLRKLSSEEMVEALLCEVLASYKPDDHRTFEVRLQLVDALSDVPTTAAMAACLPYLVDHDDGVRLKVLELIDGKIGRDHELYDKTLNGLIEVLKDPMASGAISRRAAEMISKFDADLRAHVDTLAAFLPDGFVLGSNGRLKRG